MFVPQTKMSVLTLPYSRVASVYRSVTDIQLALPELPAQMASAYMIVLKGGGKVQVLVGLFMTKSLKSLFYLSEAGEVPVERAATEIEAGLEFAESMGFVLQDMEFERMTLTEQELFWNLLPICQRQKAEAPTPEKPAEPIAPPTPPPAAPAVVEPAKAAKPEAASAAPPRQGRGSMRFTLAPEALPQRSTPAAKPASADAAVSASERGEAVRPDASTVSAEAVDQALASLRPQPAKVDARTLRRHLKEHLGRLLASL